MLFPEKPENNHSLGRQPVLLAIAGYDPSGGGGVLADIRAARFCNVRAIAAITAVTAQNTRQITQVQTITADMLKAQLELLHIEFSIQAVKIGMLANTTLIETVADFLNNLPLSIPVVLDPVLKASAGMPLLKAPIETLFRLFPRCTLLTPNLPELAQLAEIPEMDAIQNREYAVARLHKRGAHAILVKGGHDVSDTVTDTLHIPGLPPKTFSSPRMDLADTRGTGCFLSSSIAAALLRGFTLEKALLYARKQLLRHATKRWQPSANAGKLFSDFPPQEGKDNP